jgi:hypothetical protein
MKPVSVQHSGVRCEWELRCVYNADAKNYGDRGRYFKGLGE